MRCLCCGLEIEDPSEQEQNSFWHRHCIRNFFGTETLPFIEISDDELNKIASQGVDQGSTVPGAQRKLSLHHESSDGRGNRLTLVDRPAGYILKPQSYDYEDLPEAEFLAMQLSKRLGIKTVPFALIKLKDSLAYITKRIDREGEAKLAMEDFCQLSERLSEDKYSGSYEGCARVIKRYSDHPGLDLSELFVRVVGAFMIGNADLHLKNLSLIESAPASRAFGLSDAYDILPVNVVDEHNEEELALSLNGRKNKLQKSDFLEFASHCSLSPVAAEKIIAKLISKKGECIKMVQESWLGDELKEKMVRLIDERVERLS